MMKDLKSIILFLVVFTFVDTSVAQISIDGTVSDADLNPIENVLVEIFNQEDSLMNYSAVTDQSGYFIISDITDVNNPELNIPKDYLTVRNYPNPFNPSTIIQFELPKAENITIKIFDILGREVRTVFDGFHKAGIGHMNWDGMNDFSQPVAAGVYLCQLRTGDRMKVHKMMLLDGGSYIASSSKYRVDRSKPSSLPKINSSFNFGVKISGDSILVSEFKELICTGDTTLNLQVPKLYKTTTIGTEGGILETNEFQLSVPNGAFTNDANLKMYKDPYNAFGENSCSPLFHIEGLPDEFSQPLQIGIKYNGPLSGENAIAFGKKEYALEIDSNNISYNVISATESNGMLICELPASSNIDIPKQLTKTNKFKNPSVFMGLTLGSNVGKSHFDYKYFASNLSNEESITLELFLNQMYTKYENLGFDYSKVSWPITVTTYNSVNFLSNTYSTAIGIPPNFQVKDELKSLERIFVYAITAEITDLPKTNWFNLAFANHIQFNIEEYFQRYSNNTMQRILLETFRGIENYDLSIPSSYTHGLGMTILLDFLVTGYGENIISPICNDIGGGKNQVQAIIDNTDNPQMWLQDFYQLLMVDETLKARDDDFWSTNATRTFDLALLNDEKTATDDFFDLSGKWYKLNLSENIGPRTKLEITSNSTGISQISVFTMKNNELTFVNNTENELAISDVEKFANEGKDLIVLITNPNGHGEFKGTSEITTKFKLTGKFNTAEVSFGKIDGSFTKSYENGESEDFEGIVSNFFWSEPFGGGQSNETSFSLAYDVIEDDSREEFYMTATLNENWDMILSCNVLHVSAGLSDVGWQGIDSVAFSATNIPLVSKGNNVLSFKLEGAAVANMVFYTYKYIELLNGEFQTETVLTSYGLRSNSSLRIDFYDN